MLVDGRPVMTLLVTHDVDDAVRLGDRLFLLSPRPARIAAMSLPIPTPRGARGDAEIATIKSDIVRRMQADRAPDEMPDRQVCRRMLKRSEAEMEGWHDAMDPGFGRCCCWRAPANVAAQARAKASGSGT